MPSRSLPLDAMAVAGMIALLLLAGARIWLDSHPEQDPWAPLLLDDPPGWATDRKLAALRSNPSECRATLKRSGIEFRSLDPLGEGACRRDDRTQLGDLPLAPDRPVATCPVNAALARWTQTGLRPLTEEILGADLARIEHFGAYSCRRLYGRDSGAWSEHATGNAIDISGFVLADGRRISILGDWDETSDEARFLRAARDAACESFGTVLSPDYNDAHADHFHLDQAPRGFGAVCR